MSSTFGTYVRKKREALLSQNPNYSLRKVAQRVGFQPAFLSKVQILILRQLTFKTASPEHDLYFLKKCAM